MSGGQRQTVAIARALHFNARILIMHEPTAALGPEETKNVGLLIKEVKRQGLGIFLISHDMYDVFELSDRITVMKSGGVVGSYPTRDLT
jgi:D-xylose transport system ATP-binding protein